MWQQHLYKWLWLLVFVTVSGCSGGGAFETTTTDSGSTTTGGGTGTVIDTTKTGTITIATPKIVPAGIDRATIKIAVHDGDSIPLSNIPLIVSAASDIGTASVNNAAPVTDSSGVATVIVSATSGAVLVTVGVDNTKGNYSIKGGGSFTINFGATISQTTVINNLQPANGSSAVTVQVRVQNSQGFPIEGIPASLSFESNSSAIPLTMPTATDASGLFSVNVVSSIAGKTKVTPLIDNYTGTPVELEFAASVPQSPASLDVIAVKSVAPPDGNSAINLIAIARDQAGVPIPDVAITLNSSSKTAVVDPLLGNTGAGAKFEFSVTDTVQESVTLTVKAGQGAGQLQVTKTITFRADNANIAVSSVITQVSGNANTLANGVDEAVVTVIVLNAAGSPIAGVDVGFVVPVASLKLNPASGKTDQSGRFTTRVSSSLVGVFTLKPIVNSVLRDDRLATLTFGGATGANSTPTSLVVLISNAPQPADGVSTVNLFAVVRDTNKTPISGVKVALSSASPAAKLRKYGDDPTVIAGTNYLVGTTDASGSFAFTLTSNAQGAVEVTASLPDYAVQSAVGQITFSEAVSRPPETPIASVTLAADVASQVADNTAVINIAAIVRDASGVPINGLTVKLATSPVGSQAIFGEASGVTGTNGVFNTTIKNTKAEQVQVIATAFNKDGTSVKSASTLLTFTVATGAPGGVVPASLRLEIFNNPALPNGQAKITLRAIALDANKNALPGVTVRLTVTAIEKPGPLFVFAGQGEGKTGSNGAFDETMTSTTPGSLQVTATDGNINSNTVTVIFVTASTQQPAQLTLLTSSPELPSNNPVDGVSITAQVKTAANTPFANAKINFIADSGLIEPLVATGAQTAGVTNASGIASARLGTGGDPSNRTITLIAGLDGQDCSIATVGTNPLCAKVVVNVTGTKLGVNGVAKTTVCKANAYVITLTDANDKPIANKELQLSLTGNTGASFVAAGTTQCVSSNSTTLKQNTDSQGRVSVTVLPTIAGQATLTASALGANVDSVIEVATAQNVATIRPFDQQNFTGIKLRTPTQFVINITPEIAGDVTVSTTRGHIATTEAIEACDSANPLFFPTQAISISPTAQQTPDGFDYHGSFYLCADNVGPAVVTVEKNDSGISINQSINVGFIPAQADVMTLQANPASIGINAQGSDTQQSEIIAVLRDSNDNLVPKQSVNFSLSDVTAGRLTQASTVSDQFGRATTIFIAGNSPTAAGGVVISAQLRDNPAVKAVVTVTVAKREAFIILGTGNTIEELNTTVYAYPYTALVTDVEGVPIGNAQLTLSAIPINYYTGLRVLSIAGQSWGTLATYRCLNEDIDRDALLDLGEDNNSNGILDPRNIATFDPATVVTNASGFANFKVLYPQEYAYYADIEIRARTVVSGSESIATADFTLRGLDSDFKGDAAPPGPISPYGLEPFSSLVVNQPALNNSTGGISNSVTKNNPAATVPSNCTLLIKSTDAAYRIFE